MGGLSSLNWTLIIVTLFIAYEKGFVYPLMRTGSCFALFSVVMIYLKQDQMLYVPNPNPGMPQPKEKPDPQKLGMPFEEINIKAADGVCLHGWFIKRQTDQLTRDAPTIVYYHANAGTIFDRVPMYFQLWETLKVNIIAAEYRGYGESLGIPSEEGIKMDSIAFYRYALEHDLVAKNKVFVFGRSLGGAVATFVSAAVSNSQSGVPALTKPAGLILENTFTCVADVAVVVLPILRPLYLFLKPPLLMNTWESKKLMKTVTCPVLFISGLQDELIPPRQMKSLYNSCDNSRSNMFCTVANGGHNDTPICAGDEYYEVLQDYMNSILKPCTGKPPVALREIHNPAFRTRNVSTTSDDGFFGGRF